MIVATRVAVVESDLLSQLGLVAAFDHDGRFHICGVGTDARSALAGKPQRPAVVLVGSHRNHRGLSRFYEAIKEVRIYFPRGPVVALSPEPVAGAGHGPASNGGRKGGWGTETIFLDPGTHPLDIPKTVLQAAILFNGAGVREAGLPGPDGFGILDPAERFTPREWQVVRLLADRWESKEIAATLGISHSTVRSHLRSVYAKFGVRNRRDAIQRAVRLMRALQMRDGQGGLRGPGEVEGAPVNPPPGGEG